MSGRRAARAGGGGGRTRRCRGGAAGSRRRASRALRGGLREGQSARPCAQRRRRRRRARGFLPERLASSRLPPRRPVPRSASSATSPLRKRAVRSRAHRQGPRRRRPAGVKDAGDLLLQLVRRRPCPARAEPAHPSGRRGMARALHHLRRGARRRDLGARGRALSGVPGRSRDRCVAGRGARLLRLGHDRADAQDRGARHPREPRRVLLHPGGTAAGVPRARLSAGRRRADGGARALAGLAPRTSPDPRCPWTCALAWPAPARRTPRSSTRRWLPSPGRRSSSCRWERPPSSWKGRTRRRGTSSATPRRCMRSPRPMPGSPSGRPRSTRASFASRR